MTSVQTLDYLSPNAEKPIYRGQERVLWLLLAWCIYYFIAPLVVGMCAGWTIESAFQLWWYELSFHRNAFGVHPRWAFWCSSMLTASRWIALGLVPWICCTRGRLRTKWTPLIIVLMIVLRLANHWCAYIPYFGWKQWMDARWLTGKLISCWQFDLIPWLAVVALTNTGRSALSFLFASVWASALGALIHLSYITGGSEISLFTGLPFYQYVVLLIALAILHSGAGVAITFRRWRWSICLLMAGELINLYSKIYLDSPFRWEDRRSSVLLEILTNTYFGPYRFFLLAVAIRFTWTTTRPTQTGVERSSHPAVTR